MLTFEKNTLSFDMKSCIDQTNDEINELIKNHDKYDFPSFLLKLRKTLGKSKSLVSCQIRISYDQLYRLENGMFNLADDQRISRIAIYYGVDPEILIRKCKEFIVYKKAEQN